jgi:hypothetical protein
MKSKLRLFLIALTFVSSYSHADIIGAGIGGLIGSQFGQGNGKIAMAALGAVVGDRVSEGINEQRRNNFRNDGNENYPERRPGVYQRPDRYESAPAFVEEPVRVTAITPGRAYQPSPYQSNYINVYPQQYYQPGITIGAYRSFGGGFHRGHGGYGGYSSYGGHHGRHH